METFKRVPRSIRIPPEMETEIKRRTEIPGRRMPMAQWIRNAIEKALRDEVPAEGLMASPQGK